MEAFAAGFAMLMAVLYFIVGMLNAFFPTLLG
jgi:hypothetical protein